MAMSVMTTLAPTDAFWFFSFSCYFSVYDEVHVLILVAFVDLNL